MSCVNIVMGLDKRGFGPAATVINSVRAHCPQVHVRILTREKLDYKYQAGSLKVEFVHVPEQYQFSGPNASYVSDAAFDRVAAIKLCPDWDRALILDYDQIVLEDISDLFEMDMGDSFIAGRLASAAFQHNVKAAHKKDLYKLRPQYANYRLLLMGVLMNLKQMRQEDVWETLTQEIATNDFDEQTYLMFACKDRVIELPAVYNVFSRDRKRIRNPKIFHFAGSKKPWQADELPNSSYWRKYQTTWESLTAGRIKI